MTPDLVTLSIALGALAKLALAAAASVAAAYIPKHVRNQQAANALLLAVQAGAGVASDAVGALVGAGGVHPAQARSALLASGAKAALGLVQRANEQFADPAFVAGLAADLTGGAAPVVLPSSAQAAPQPAPPTADETAAALIARGAAIVQQPQPPAAPAVAVRPAPAVPAAPANT